MGVYNEQGASVGALLFRGCKFSVSSSEVVASWCSLSSRLGVIAAAVERNLPEAPRERLSGPRSDPENSWPCRPGPSCQSFEVGCVLSNSAARYVNESSGSAAQLSIFTRFPLASPAARCPCSNGSENSFSPSSPEWLGSIREREKKIRLSAR